VKVTGGEHRMASPVLRGLRLLEGLRRRLPRTGAEAVTAAASAATVQATSKTAAPACTAVGSADARNQFPVFNCARTPAPV